MITILLIEDDIADQQIFKRYLNKTDFDIKLVIAGSLSEAKESIMDIQIDLAFCDFNLPDGNAIEFLQHTKDWENFPIVVITSNGDIERATESLKKGAFDFITKDNINPPGLLRTIQNANRYKGEHRLRQKLEIELQKSYLNTKAILDNTTSNIWSLDVDGKLLLINERAIQSFKEHLGISPRVGELLLKEIPESFSSHWLPLFEQALTGKIVSAVEKYVLNGETFFLQVDCCPIQDGDHVNGAIFFLTDVTVKESTGMLIRESERNFRAIFEGSDMAIIVEELENNTIIDLNQAAADLHNYTIEEMVGMSIYDTIPPDHLEKSQVNYHKHLKGEIDDLDSFVYTSDKIKIPVHIELNRINYNGQECNLLMMQDISIRKETEKNLAEAKNLAEQTAEFRSSFLANMSHEIRTPMNAMIGFTDLLDGTGLSDEQSEYVDIIRESGNDLLVIINDILDISKIQAGKMEIRQENVEIDELLRRVLQLHKYKAEDRGITLNLELQSQLPRTIFVDPTRFSQILNNLVSNAIKFTEEGGVKILVNLETDKLGIDQLHFEVKDTGIGIPKDKLSEIFSDFSQVDSSLQRQHTGTGLGLSIVYQMTELMNGKCWAESEIGEGTSFHVILPIKPAEVDVTSEEEGKNNLRWEDLDGTKLLVVEDNEVNTLLAKRTLSKFNFELQFAENGKIAVQKAQEFEPDIIFMDVQMPIMNGYDSTREIRKFSTVPIIAMTAHVLDEEKKKCEEAGMNGFIPKPFKQQDILIAIAAIQDKLSPLADSSAVDPISDIGIPNLTAMAEGDIEFVKKLMDTFLKNAVPELTELQNVKAPSELETVQYLVHKLRSSFVLFEFQELYDLSVKLEANPTIGEELIRFNQLLAEKIEFIQSRRKMLQ